ncbi:putative serine/threonine-protein phosphatase with EF-hands 1 [Blattamonas nauphoetae]|uniref:Serine/threonine-protein phosphatase with EF-hands 1 n=1 Tax=Blattamonas nauphoetae TaxID=2049346 RepID=A0ABQ9YLH0_9EUKA|nr:putative serine/threonine-protein phosphatase with EF-hands 1 [Blattamonas nauphoetae]
MFLLSHWFQLLSALLILLESTAEFNESSARENLSTPFQTLNSFITTFETTPPLISVNIPPPNPNHRFSDNEPHIHLVGDLHGDFDSFASILQQTGLPSPDNRFIFLGDYVDRGNYSVETFITLLALKLRTPQSVHLIIGNHEGSPHLHFRYGFLKELVQKYGQVGDTTVSMASSSLYLSFLSAFACLPIGAVLETNSGSSNVPLSAQPMFFTQSSSESTRMPIENPYSAGHTSTPFRALCIHGGIPVADNSGSDFVEFNLSDLNNSKIRDVLRSNAKSEIDEFTEIDTDAENVVGQVIWNDPASEKRKKKRGRKWLLEFGNHENEKRMKQTSQQSESTQEENNTTLTNNNNPSQTQTSTEQISPDQIKSNKYHLSDDPQFECEPHALLRSKRGKTIFAYSSCQTDSFLKRNNITTLIRAHEKVDDGWKLDHSGTVLTVFSTKQNVPTVKPCFLTISFEYPRWYGDEKETYTLVPVYLLRRVFEENEEPIMPTEL